MLVLSRGSGTSLRAFMGFFLAEGRAELRSPQSRDSFLDSMLAGLQGFGQRPGSLLECLDPPTKRIVAL